MANQAAEPEAATQAIRLATEVQARGAPINEGNHHAPNKIPRQESPKRITKSMLEASW